MNSYKEYWEALMETWHPYWCPRCNRTNLIIGGKDHVALCSKCDTTMIKIPTKELFALYPNLDLPKIISKEDLVGILI